MAKIGMISLGCPRNLVDSEVMLGMLRDRGHDIMPGIEGSDVAIVKTCAFIKDATEESLETIFSLIELKKAGSVPHIVVAGCLPQRYKKDLRKDLKEIDAFVGTGDIERIGAVIESVLDRKNCYAVSEEPLFVHNHRCKRSFITPPHYAYLKIQEGCSNRCSYCVIPDLRGKLRSRPMESVIEEAEGLAASGVSELDIVGQDTTAYGTDIYGKSRLAHLLRSLAGRNTARWIRLLYAHPAHFTGELIDTISRERSICRYVDLPVQHISDGMLKRMNRGIDGASTRALIRELRNSIEGLAIRTTVLVGFPGETGSDFRELMDFLAETRFERLGAFMYSNEEGSRSSSFGGQVPDDVKKERHDAVMRLQQDISREHNSAFLGRELEVLIDEICEDDEGMYIGRTEHDAPSVDGTVFVKGYGLKPGDFTKVRVTDTLEYDLVGEAL
jgi:ribosomal protein S12 methylthiotransferase